MKYICKTCNYETDDSGNWIRHKKSKRHVKKCIKDTNDDAKCSRNVAENVADCSRDVAGKNICNKIQSIENKKFICSSCNTIFKHHSSYYRHLNKRCKIEPFKDVINNLQHQLGEKENEIEKKNTAIELLKMQNIMNENEKHIYKDENEYHKTLTNNAGMIIDKSLSTIAFVMQNFKDAPPIKAISNDDFKRLVYEDNYGKKIHRNKKISNFEISKLLNGYQRHNNFLNLINNIIVKHYKKMNPRDQSLWSSDTSRLTYSILQMNLDCKTVFLRKTILEAKLLCKNSRVVFQ
jgi:hypothetical protein